MEDNSLVENKDIGEEANFDCFSLMFVAGLLGYKAAYLTKAFNFSIEPAYLLTAVSNDLQLVGLVLILSYFRSFFKKKLWKVFIGVFLACLSVWYFVDTLVIVNLNSRVTVSELLNYTTELLYTRGGTFLLFASIGLLLLISWGDFFGILVRRRILGIILSLTLLFFPLSSRFGELETYSTPINFDTKIVFGSPQVFYTEEELESLSASSPHISSVSFGESNPNVILVIVESLSAGDSFKTSGLKNLFPKLDIMAEDGRLFRNFFTNYINTEGGVISILLGTPPIQYPGSNWNQYRSYTDQETAIQKLPKEYVKHLYASADINFQGEHEFLEKVGFDEVRTLLNEPYLQNAPKFVFKSPPDSYLYEYAQIRLPKLMESEDPFFMVVQTTTSHLPYIDPLGRKSTEENVLGYVDDQLYQFYQYLRNTSFFENGILVVTCDHRKMMPITKPERELYAGTAEHRGVLLVIGKDVPANTYDDRYIQQSDLVPMLSRLSSDDAKLSEVVIMLERYSKPVFEHAESVGQSCLGR